MGKICIGICDDQSEIVEELGELVKKVLEEIPFNELRILKSTSPLKILREIKNIDILFLDMDMPEMDGIKAGKEVMLENPACKIIIATAREDRVKEAFFISAFRFITKPFKYEELKEAVITALEETPGDNEIEAFRERVSFNLKERDISMIRAYNGYVEIMVGDNVFRKDISLNALEEQLDDRIFFRINRQYLVNFRHISSYKKNKVVVNNKTFVISVRRHKEFFKKYMEYDLRYS
ncbi:MAG: response regulator transcription factor [Butyrivibrio sp.]|nr:response regulator transcription factor [Butyrivibrio sp.]